MIFQPADAASNLQLDKPGDGSYRIRVKPATDGKAITYVDWVLSTAPLVGDASALTRPIEPTERPKLNLTFNPARNYLRVEGDFIDFDNRAAIDHCRAEVVDAKGKHGFAQADLKLDSLAYVHGLLKLGQYCPAGDYVARLTCYDTDGKKVVGKESESPFVKKDPAK